MPRRPCLRSTTTPRGVDALGAQIPHDFHDESPHEVTLPKRLLWGRSAYSIVRIERGEADLLVKTTDQVLEPRNRRVEITLAPDTRES